MYLRQALTFENIDHFNLYYNTVIIHSFLRFMNILKSTFSRASVCYFESLQI